VADIPTRIMLRTGLLQRQLPKNFNNMLKSAGLDIGDSHQRSNQTMDEFVHLLNEGYPTFFYERESEGLFEVLEAAAAKNEDVYFKIGFRKKERSGMTKNPNFSRLKTLGTPCPRLAGMGYMETESPPVVSAQKELAHMMSHMHVAAVASVHIPAEPKPISARSLREHEDMVNTIVAGKEIHSVSNADDIEKALRKWSRHFENQPEERELDIGDSRYNLSCRATSWWHRAPAAKVLEVVMADMMEKELVGDAWTTAP
jgi:hypothetical protein